MTREERAREMLAHNLEAAGFLALARAARGTGLETFVSTALAFADAEAAAMRERAAGVAEHEADAARPYASGAGLSSANERHKMLQAERIATAIRNLPTTGEE